MRKTFCDMCGAEIPKKTYDSTEFDHSEFYFHTGDTHVVWSHKSDLCKTCTDLVRAFIKEHTTSK